MARFLVMADGPDEPGIVAAVTGVLADEGCNLEDTSMTRLGGRFVMLLMVNSSDDLSGDALLARLSERTSSLSLNIGIDWMADGPDAGVAVSGERWAISVHGSDHPGIVCAIARELADRGVNIDDLTTRVLDAAGGSAYTMLIDATIPAAVDTDDLVASLARVAGRMDVACHAHPVDADVL